MLNDLLMTFQANRKLTYDILESLNDTEIEKNGLGQDWILFLSTFKKWQL